MGGAVFVCQSALIVGKSAFLENRTDGTGGAIASLCMPAAAPRVANSLISGNVASAGGAFHGTHMTFLDATLVMNGGAAMRRIARRYGLLDRRRAGRSLDGFGHTDEPAPGRKAPSAGA